MDNQHLSTPQENIDTFIKSPSSSRKKPLLLGLFTITFISILATSAYLLGVNNAKPIDLTTTNPTQTPEPTIDPAADWKTYIGDGFTFKYHPSDILKEEANFITWDSLYQDGSTRQNMFLKEITATELKPKVGSQITVGTYSFQIENIENEEKIMLGNKEADYYTISCGMHCYYGVVDFQTENNAYRLMHNFAGGGLQSAFEKMFPTFSFTQNASTEDILMKITAVGGLCPDGPCQSERTITHDGKLATDNKTHQLTPQYIEHLTKLINATNFDKEASKPFTDTCPIAYDGLEFIYTFYTNKGIKTLSSCKSDIDYNLPIFKEISNMSKLYN